MAYPSMRLMQANAALDAMSSSRTSSVLVMKVSPRADGERSKETDPEE